jgi:hypothetical protein
MPLTELDFRLEDGRLVLEVISKGGFPKPDSPPRPGVAPAPIAFHDPDEFHVTEGVLKNNRGEFLREDDGRLAWVRFARRIHRPLTGRRRPESARANSGRANP